MKKKMILTLFVISLIYGNMNVFAYSNFPKRTITPKWAVEINKSERHSPQPDKYKSYKLLATNLGGDKLDVTFEFYRPLENKSQEQIILIDPTNYTVKPKETVEFSHFYIDTNAKELEVLISWFDQDKRKHKQSIVLNDI
ncbi:hypothetical protein [Paenibacillus apii]|uniref:hypothetical protein n=1 Tax=Paenibacillus apii TaxID=1850370 RepID=UPI00143A332A|nr:hypothetical protein [Paenibacillus apii]NJJ37849.1 hypothetical protein [Paenibacillus apii]